MRQRVRKIRQKLRLYLKVLFSLVIVSYEKCNLLTVSISFWVSESGSTLEISSLDQSSGSDRSNATEKTVKTKVVQVANSRADCQLSKNCEENTDFHFEVVIKMLMVRVLSSPIIYGPSETGGRRPEASRCFKAKGNDAL